MNEEARAGGLIDRYWIFNWIVLPVIIVLLSIVVMYLIGSSCPYKEDVSSCFPYNLPDWAKIVVPILLIVIPLIISILLVRWFKCRENRK